MRRSTFALMSDSHRRVDVLAITVLGVFVVGLIGVLARVAQLQVSPGDDLRPFIQSRISSRPEMGRRGDLVDRRGRVLAATIMGTRVFIDPVTFGAPDGEKFARIGAVVGMDAGEVADRVVPRLEANRQLVEAGENPIRYVSVGSVLTEGQAAMASEMKIAGVHTERVPVREVVGGAAAASLIGKVGFDRNGLLGAEKAFDIALQPTQGEIDYVRDARGRPLWVEAAGYQPAETGDTIRLSIDSAIQEIVEDELVRGVKDFNAAGARCVMIDPNTGEVLAIADVVRTPPDAKPFSREALKAAIASGHFVRFLTLKPDPGRTVHPSLGRNRCVEDVYEPGSTFKPFVWSSITERGLAQLGEMVNTHGGSWTTPYGRTIDDVVRLDSQTWRDVLINSSNIGMSQTVTRIASRDLRSDLSALGFGNTTKIGLPDEASGLLTSLRNWTQYTQTSVSFGYEVAVTPLQIVRAFAAFARRGDLAGTIPSLSMRALDPNAPLPVAARIYSPATARETRDAMAVVATKMAERANARFKDDPPLRYSLFGKSGTSKISRPGMRGYFERQYTSSFIAGAPQNNPKIVMVVVVDDPGPELRDQLLHFGSQTAGPILARIARRTLEYMGEVPDLPDPEGGKPAKSVAVVD